MMNTRGLIRFYWELWDTLIRVCRVQGFNRLLVPVVGVAPKP